MCPEHPLSMQMSHATCAVTCMTSRQPPVAGTVAVTPTSLIRETRAQRSQVTCVRSHSKEAAEPGWEPPHSEGRCWDPTCCPLCVPPALPPFISRDAPTTFEAGSLSPISQLRELELAAAGWGETSAGEGPSRSRGTVGLSSTPLTRGRGPAASGTLHSVLSSGLANRPARSTDSSLAEGHGRLQEAIDQK